MKTLCIKYATLLRLDPALTRSSPIPFSRFKKMSLRCEWPGMQRDGVESKTFEVYVYPVHEDFSLIEDYYEKLFGKEFQLDSYGRPPTRIDGVVAVVMPAEQRLDDETFREFFGVTRESAVEWGAYSHWTVVQHSVFHKGNKSLVYFE